MDQHNKKWVTFRPIGWVGLALVFTFLLINLLDIQNALIEYLGIGLLLLGGYFLLRGREEHPP
jgi:hypothetical protein